MLEFTTDNCSPAQMAVVDKYSLIYREADQENIGYCRDRYDELRRTGKYVNLRYGFEFGDGWLQLVENLSRDLEEIVEYVRAPATSEAEALQYFIHGCIFKEKFGELTWQGNMYMPLAMHKSIYALIRKCEADSRHTCEATGQGAALLCRPRDNPYGWLKTMCRDEAVRSNYIPVPSALLTWEGFDELPAIAETNKSE